jgi:hypothetical protein
VYARVKRPELGELLLSQTGGIRALCRLEHLAYVTADSAIPLGCVVQAVDEACDVHLLVKVRAAGGCDHTAVHS